MSVVMRTTVTIDDELIERARELTGISERATLIRMGLESLVAREAGRRIARMKGAFPDLQEVPRRRFPPE